LITLPPPSTSLFPYTTLFRSDEVVLRLSRGGKEAGVRARLLVLADGGHNRMTQHARDYRQQAIVAEVTAEHPRGGVAWERFTAEDRKSTRLNSSHVAISYAVF